MQEEAEAKVTLAAVDQQAKRLQDSSSSSQKAEQLSVPEIKIEAESESKPRKQKITLVKGKDGKVAGAEITPMEEKKKVTFQRDDGKITGAEVE